MKKFLVVLFIAVFFLCLYFGDTKKEEEKIVYVVKANDSIQKIASQFKVLPWQLREENGMSPGVIIHPGDVLKIPSPKWRTYTGKASWYGPGFHGKRMANNEIYDQEDIIIAHRTLPYGTLVKVTNLKNGKSIIAPVMDRGPYAKDENGKFLREIDLSRGAAKKLDAIEPGVIPVKIESVGVRA